MKRLLGFLTLALLSLPLFHNTAKAEKIEGVEVNKSAQGVSFTQSIDVSRYDTLSAQAVYSDGTPTSHTLTSGNKQTGTITVTTNSSQLISAQASVTINVVSTAAVQNDSVTLNGVVFTEGVHWDAETSSTTAATALKTKIDAHPDFVATSAGSTVTVKYAVYGTAGNGLPAVSSAADDLVLGASTFTGGINSYNIVLNGVTLAEGTDFNANSSSQTTARNIMTAINANSTLSAQVVASSAAAVVTVTALYPGANGYTMSASTTGFSTSGFTPGLAGDVDIQTDRITKASHGLTTGLKVKYTTTSGTAPGGLTTETTYYAIRLNENIYQLALTSTGAVAGSAIDLTTLPTDSATYTMTPPSLSAGSAGFHWQASNDGSNFANLSVSSVTYSSAGTTLWDFCEYNYKYLRLNFVGPTQGGIALNVKLFGREE